MFFLRVTIIIALFTVLLSQCEAATTGYYISSQPVFAIIPLGNINPPGSLPSRPTYEGSLALLGSDICPRVKGFSNQGANNSCYIRTGSPSNYTYSYGILYDYTVENCPIDDYIPLILLASGGIGVFFLKRRMVFF